MLHDACDAERMIEDLDGGAHFHMLRLGKKVIHQAIVRPLKGSAAEVVKRDQFLKRFEIDSVDDFEVFGSGELPDDRRHHADVGQFLNYRRRS